MNINDNSEVDLAIQRVNLAIAQSDLRATNARIAKLAKATKSRSNYSSRNNQTKAFKPNGVTMPTMASPRATERANRPASASPRAMERMTAPKSSPRAMERSTSTPAPKVSKAPFKAPMAPSATQISAAKARSGASNVYTPTTAPKPRAPRKPYVAPKPTAAQLEQGRLRGGTVGGRKPVKITGIKPLTAAQKKAVADAKKKAGGR
jgi:hypothetical protein